MKTVLLCVAAVVSMCVAAPLYGEDGGYTGHAAYVPLKKVLSRAGLHSSSGDSIEASAGSPELSRRPSHSSSGSDYDSSIVPKKYDVLEYTPSHQHGYGGNKVASDTPAAPYAHATLYGRGSGGYKIADAYQNQHIDSYTDKEHDYKDDYISYPQPYEYGYSLKDEYGNTQHKQESGDGHGNVKGTYGFTDEHGLYRSVQYVADKDGFRASIKTNEPGTENQDPADVHVESEQTKY